VFDGEFGRLLVAWFGSIARVLQPGRAFWLWCGYANIANYPAALQAAGLYFSQTVIWVKEHPVLTRKDMMGNHDWCFYGWREGDATTFPTADAHCWSCSSWGEKAGVPIGLALLGLLMAHLAFFSRSKTSTKAFLGSNSVGCSSPHRSASFRVVTSRS
jgi:hypothetical protein